jgi:hypothetical protein
MSATTNEYRPGKGERQSVTDEHIHEYLLSALGGQATFEALATRPGHFLERL